MADCARMADRKLQAVAGLRGERPRRARDSGLPCLGPLLGVERLSSEVDRSCSVPERGGAGGCTDQSEV